MKHRISIYKIGKPYGGAEAAMGFLIGISLIYLISLFLIVYAEKLVSWQAGRFKSRDERSLAYLDQLQVFDPLGRFLVGKASDFVMKGVEHPEAFPRMIWFFRLMGLIPMIAATIALIYALLRH